jgi:hypothetical protein
MAPTQSSSAPTPYSGTRRTLGRKASVCLPASRASRPCGKLGCLEAYSAATFRGGAHGVAGIEISKQVWLLGVLSLCGVAIDSELQHAASHAPSRSLKTQRLECSPPRMRRLQLLRAASAFSHERGTIAVGRLCRAVHQAGTRFSLPAPFGRAYRFPTRAYQAGRNSALFLGRNLGTKSAKSQAPERKRRPEREFGARSAIASPRLLPGPRPNLPFRALTARTESVSPEANGVGKGTGSEPSLGQWATDRCRWMIGMEESRTKS